MAPNVIKKCKIVFFLFIIVYDAKLGTSAGRIFLIWKEGEGRGERERDSLGLAQTWNGYMEFVIWKERGSEKEIGLVRSKLEMAVGKFLSGKREGARKR